ncbi:MAG: acyl-CoA dehydrogenase family protein, partial [Aldersonia sp.]|nr:acyl-CoA dehydrogenase family protein [Aldersonia sp.]
MSLALTEDHVALADVVRSFLADQKAHALARAVLDDATTDITPLWRDMAKLGWLGLHLPANYGGDEAGLPELAIVAEQLGRAVVPVPFLPTVVASSLIAGAANDDVAQRLLPGLADGSRLGGLGLGGALAPTPAGTVSGDAGYVVGGRVATLLALRAGDDVVIVDAAGAGVTVHA